MTDLVLFHPDTYELQQETQRLAASRDRTIDKMLVRQVLEENPQGLTDWEIADRIDPTRKPSLGKRRKDLGAVKVRDVDGKPLKRVCHGSPCFVWRLP